MPIPDSDLTPPGSGFFIQAASMTVHAALHTWYHLAESAEWWWLVIEHDTDAPARFTALRMADLRDVLADPQDSTHMNSHLADLPVHQGEHQPGTVVPASVRRLEMDTATARKLAARSPGQLLLVLDDDHGGQVRGVLSVGEHPPLTRRPLRQVLEDYQRAGDFDTMILPRRRLRDDDTS